MANIINETSETALVVKLVKKAIEESNNPDMSDTLTAEEVLTAHELYEDLREKEGSFYGYKGKHNNFYPELDD